MSFFDEELEIFAVFDMSPPPPDPCSYVSDQFMENLLSNLRNLRENEELCDVNLIPLENIRRIKAHKSILAAACQYFYDMFVTNRPDPNRINFEIPLIGHDVLELLVNFIYTGKIEIYNEDLYNVMTAADILKLNTVVKYCTIQFTNMLGPKNVFDIFSFADNKNFCELRKNSNKYIRENFSQVWNQPKLGILTKRQLIGFIDNHDELIVDSEQQVFNAAMIWLKHDLGRIKYVYEILSYIRMAVLSIDIIFEEINSADTDELLKVSLELINNDIADKVVGNLVDLNPRTRLGLKNNIYLLGGGQCDVSGTYLNWDYFTLAVIRSTLKFNTTEKVWFPLQPLNMNRASPAAAVLNGIIYLVGGFDKTTILSSVETYNKESNSWSYIASMVIPRCSLGLVAMNGVLYAVGGLTGSQSSDDICNPTSSTATNLIEIYSPPVGIWAIFNKQLPESRFNMGVAAYKDLIYIVGGRDKHNKTLKTMYNFNPVTGNWGILPSMLIKRSSMGIAIMDKHMYVVGGIGKDREVLTMVEKYDLENNTWSYINPMKEKRASPAVAAIDGMLYVIGGHRVLCYMQRSDTPDYISISTVERYDTRTETWEFQSNLPFSRSEAGVAIM